MPLFKSRWSQTYIITAYREQGPLHFGKPSEPTLCFATLTIKAQNILEIAMMMMKKNQVVELYGKNRTQDILEFIGIL